MKDTFLQIAGVKSEKEFYKKYPTEEAFFQAYPEAMQMKHGGAVDLNAFYNQPRFIQTNIYQEGGEFFTPEYMAQFGGVMLHDYAGQPEYAQGGPLPEYQFAGELAYKNPWFNNPDALKQPSPIMTPEQQAVFNKNKYSFGTPPTPPADKPTPTTGVPKLDPTLPINQSPAAAAAVGAAAGATAGSTIPPAKTATGTGPTEPAKPTGPSTLGPGQYKMQEVAKHQMIGNKMYKNISDLATMPLYNPMIGMMSDNGLQGYLKMGLGALAGVSGMATGLDNVWRGFKARKPDEGPPVNTNPKAVGNNLKWSDPNNAAALNQETVQQEAARKAASAVNPPAAPTTPLTTLPTGFESPVDMNRTAAYGGMIKAAGGMQVPGTTPQTVQPTDYTQKGNPVYVGESRLAVDLQGGLNRTLGANAGISMFNNALGFKQGMKQVRENTVKQGMTDFAYQPDDTQWMPMGYDTLNTGPGQTQAPNLYTPVQYTGMQMQSQFQEGGEYDLTEEEIQAILAAGGDIEFM